MSTETMLCTHTVPVGQRCSKCWPDESFAAVPAGLTIEKLASIGACAGVSDVPQAGYCTGACDPMQNWRLESGEEICQCDSRHPFGGSEGHPSVDAAAFPDPAVACIPANPDTPTTPRFVITDQMVAAGAEAWDRIKYQYNSGAEIAAAILEAASKV